MTFLRHVAHMACDPHPEHARAAARAAAQVADVEQTHFAEGRTVVAKSKGEWLILRTSGSRTLSLVKSLTDARIDAWTPIAKVTRRLSRKPVRVYYDAPFAPTYVFVRADHLPQLNRCLSLPVNPHPAFSIYRPNGTTAYVADRELNPLRAVEERSQQLADKRRADDERGTAEPYARGDAVTMLGAFAGLAIEVSDSDRRWTHVVMGSGFTLKIDTSQLRRLGVPESTAG